jgi:hypothetical protein
MSMGREIEECGTHFDRLLRAFRINREINYIHFPKFYVDSIVNGIRFVYCYHIEFLYIQANQKDRVKSEGRP